MGRRWHLFFSGQVQGVGFRYTSLVVAQRFQITGWVRNLADRRVEMVIEGDSGELQKYVDEVRESTYGNVTDVQIERAEPTGEFPSFEIRKG